MMKTPIAFIIARFTIYTLVVFSFTLSLPYIVKEGDPAAFHEDGFIEWMQFACLLLAVLIFCLRAWMTPDYREILYWLAALACFAAIREMDATLDEWVPVIGWKFAYLVVVYPAILIWKNWDGFIRQLGVMLESQAFALLWAGFIVAIPAAQLIGHGPLLESLMGESYDHIYKRVIEESGEIIGYMLLVAGAVETYFSLGSQGRSSDRQKFPA